MRNSLSSVWMRTGGEAHPAVASASAVKLMAPTGSLQMRALRNLSVCPLRG